MVKTKSFYKSSFLLLYVLCLIATVKKHCSFDNSCSEEKVVGLHGIGYVDEMIHDFAVIKMGAN